ncbi:MAG TPA: hypothetical protein VHY79_18870 [Rhizomicrobium sp.]|nr:hypothetical protein [Rhizomicrobium sp.]
MTSTRRRQNPVEELRWEMPAGYLAQDGSGNHCASISAKDSRPV